MERHPKMSIRRWLVPLLLLALGYCSALHARQPKRIALQLKDEERPSHRPIDSDLEDDLKPEDLLARRLLDSRKWLEKEEFRAHLKKLAQDLMKDPNHLEKIQKSLKASGFKSKDIERLLKDFQGGKVGNNDEAKRFLQALLDANEKGKGLSINPDLLKGFDAFRPNSNAKNTPVPSPDKMPNLPPVRSGPTPPPVEGKSPTKLPDESSEWLAERAKAFEKWFESPAGQSWQESVKRLAQGRWEGGSLPKLGQRASGFMRYLPRPSSLLPKSLNVQPPEPRLPSLPNIALPSAPRLPSAPSAETGKAILWLVIVGVMVFVLWRGGGWWQKYQASRKDAWRLGPWPVRPEAVSTRDDLVRAFEHLALLCLGPTARTRHHLELGEQIGRQPAPDPDRRRDAATTLARLYEQARYAPDQEPLPPESLANARRELCYLAGVTPL
jgi:hypothetical protein